VRPECWFPYIHSGASASAVLALRDRNLQPGRRCHSTGHDLLGRCRRPHLSDAPGLVLRDHAMAGTLVIADPLKNMMEHYFEHDRAVLESSSSSIP